MSGVKPAMTQDKAPDWAEKEAGALALDYVDWLGRDKVDRDAEHVLTNIVALALSQAYERGQADSRTSFIEWLRPWVKRRFGKWITHNTATGAFNEYQSAIRSLPIEQEGGE